MDPYYDMFLRTAVLTDTVPTFDQMLGIYSLDNWQPAGTAYLYGWSLVDYIARRYGEEKLAAINQSAGSLRTIGLFSALTRSLGLPPGFLGGMAPDLKNATKPRPQSCSGGLTALKN